MNKFIGKGRLVADPDVRYSTNSKGEQMAIARYRLAINRKGKDAGADFINCVAFGKSGEFAEKYLKKGQEILIEGEVRTGSYDNKDGQKVYTTDIVVENHEFCGTKQEQPQSEPSNGYQPIPEGIEDSLPFK